MNRLPTKLRTAVEYLTIVPEAHTRIFDLELQWKLYEVFHTTAITRIGHLLGTPVILMGALLLAASVPLGPVDLGLVFIAILGLWYITVDRLVGVLLSALLLGAWLAVAREGFATPALGGLLVVAGTGVQTLSHLGEPLPPPWSGTRSWRSLGELWRTAPRWRFLALPGLFVCSVFLELWAAPRVFPYEGLYLLSHFGYRSDERERLLQERERIFADCSRGWRSEATRQ